MPELLLVAQSDTGLGPLPQYANLRGLIGGATGGGRRR